MNFKRVFRHPNTIQFGFVLLVLGLGLGLFVVNDFLKILGLGFASLGLLIVVIASYENQAMFWRAQLEWWDENDTRFDAWQEGKQ
jgi:hypothetical protein